MPKLKQKTERELKQRLLSLVDKEYRVTNWFAVRIKRSHTYTLNLLCELAKGNKIKMKKIVFDKGLGIAWVKNKC